MKSLELSPGMGLCHLALCVSCTIAIEHSQLQSNACLPALLAFVAILSYGVVGFLRYVVPGLRSNIRLIRLSVILQLLARNVALPGVVTYLYITYKYSSAFAYLHLASGTIPVIFYLTKPKGSLWWSDTILAVNIASLVWVSYSLRNVWGVGLAVCHFLNHFCIDKVMDHTSTPMDSLFVVGMCFFNVFAVKTVNY